MAAARWAVLLVCLGVAASAPLSHQDGGGGLVVEDVLLSEQADSEKSSVMENLNVAHDILKRCVVLRTARVAIPSCRPPRMPKQRREMAHSLDQAKKFVKTSSEATHGLQGIAHASHNYTNYASSLNRLKPSSCI